MSIYVLRHLNQIFRRQVFILANNNNIRTVPLPVACIWRYNHNNLYQMSSEASRSKVCQNTELLRGHEGDRSDGGGGGDDDRTGGGAGGGTGGGGGAGAGSPGGKGKGDESPSDMCRRLFPWFLAALGAGGFLWWCLSKRGGAGGGTGDCKKDGYGGAGYGPGYGPGGYGAGAGAGPGGAGGAGVGGPGSGFAGGAAVGSGGGTRTIPASSADLPNHVPYLLIGGGTASFSAFRAIKSNDAKAKVLMISNEFRKPYMRPPLSKELWYSAQNGEVAPDYKFKQWTGAERSLFFEPDEFFVDPTKLMDSVNGGIAVAQGFTVKKIDYMKRIVTLNDGYQIGYDECLVATGCSPKNLDVFSNAPISVKHKVMLYRTPDDFDRLKRYADEKKSITIIGNGFTGSELACSLANYARDKKVRIFQIFPESGNMAKVLPDYLSKWTMSKVESLGVCVLSNASVKEAQRDENMLKLTLSNGNIVRTDVVVVCVGCEPNTALAHVSGLEVDRKYGGFVVNAELEARRNLYAAGDASCFFDPLLGRRRVEHHDHSVVSGRLAGENMVGKKKEYTHQSMFWSDLGPDIGYEGIGLVDSSLPTVGVFALPTKTDRTTDNLTETREMYDSNKSIEGKDGPDVTCEEKDGEDYGRGVIFYMKDDKIVGILLWNLFNRIGLARTIINQNKKFDDLNEVAKLFEIYS